MSSRWTVFTYAVSDFYFGMMSQNSQIIGGGYGEAERPVRGLFKESKHKVMHVVAMSMQSIQFCFQFNRTMLIPFIMISR